jgi:hypothetical protein
VPTKEQKQGQTRLSDDAGDKRRRHTLVLELLQADERLSWVRDQLLASFGEGITQSAKDSAFDPVKLPDADVMQRERTKREKYESSRPYDEAEKVALIEQALHEVFVTIPAMVLATTESLVKLGVEALVIEFSAPDEEEGVEAARVHVVEMDSSTAAELRHRLEVFKANLEP